MTDVAIKVATHDEQIATLRRDVDAHGLRITAVEKDVSEVRSDLRVISTKQLVGYIIAQMIATLAVGLGGAVLGAWATTWF